MALRLKSSNFTLTQTLEADIRLDVCFFMSKICSGIKDYSALKHLISLEYLRLEGNYSIPGLSFIPYLSNLKVFDLRMRVEDVDLSMCLSLPHIRVNKLSRYYNIEEWEIPKDLQHYTTGNENIPEWRCLRA